MPDEAVRWLIARGRRGQWGDQAFSAQPEWVAKVRHWAAGDGLWIGELGGVPAGAMVLGAARPYVPTVSEPEVYGEGRTERIDERYPAARR